MLNRALGEIDRRRLLRQGGEPAAKRLVNQNIAVAIAESGRDGEVRNHGLISSSLHSVEKLLRKLGHPHKELRVCYEAGPCGFVLARRLKQLGITCDVVAPSLTPKGSGDKIKTDRRDARMLARLHRAGELTAVHIPDERDEAIRDLCRARTDAVQDLRSGRHQLKAFLLRNGYRYSEKTSWGVAHMRYLRELVLSHPAMKIVLEEYLQCIDAANERIERLEVHMSRAQRDRQYEVLPARGDRRESTHSSTTGT